MPKPMAICIEDVDARNENEKYLRCVALVGREAGLRVDAHGAVLWKSDEDAACELWVSADNCLILYRPEGAVAVKVCRAGRGLDVPAAKPVVLLDKDQVVIGDRVLRVHVHGEAPGISAPSPFVPGKKTVSAWGKAAAALAIGSVVGGAGCEVRQSPPVVVAPEPPPKPPVEVRDQPPEVAAPEEKPAPESKGDPGKQPKEGPVKQPEGENKIEVRDNPPDVAEEL